MVGKKLLKFEPPRPSVYTPFLRRFTDERAHDLAETIALYRRVTARYRASLWAEETRLNAVNHVIAEHVVEDVGLPDVQALIEALDNCQRAVLAKEAAIFSSPEIDWDTAILSLHELVDLRRFLRAQEHFLANEEKIASRLINAVKMIFSQIIEALPSAMPEDASNGITTPLYSSIDDVSGLVSDIIDVIMSSDLLDVGLCTELQDTIYANICAITGITVDVEPKKPLTMPKASRLSDEELIKGYLSGTPFLALFMTPLPFALPQQTRFEHHHIVAGSGHGKTQTLQYLIAHDLQLVARRQASVVVIDSQGDLIRTIKKLDLVDEDNLVLIDPTDVSFPVCLNLFDVQMERINSYSRLHREQMLNGILELYDFVLGSLLGAEMTQKQSVIFRYVTRLLLHIPDATIHTMLALFQDGGTQKYRKHIEELEGTARLFFEEEFDSKEFSQTKRQVVRRLYGILENQTFNRMFSHPRSKLDLFSEMNAGKVILINTAKDLLKETGTEIFGRFFIAMITQAAQERAAMPADERIPTFVYIDEAQDYFDENIEIILSQARKYRVGIVMAHQYLDQLSPRLQSAFMSNTSIKFAGGLSAKDARALAGEMQVPPDFILGQKRGSFAATVRGVTKQAVSLAFPFGFMENLPRHSGAEMERIQGAMRHRFAVPIDELDKQERERWTKEPGAGTRKPEGPQSETTQRGGRSSRKPPSDDDYTFDTTPTPDLK